MTGFSDAFSRYAEGFSNYVKKRYRSLADWFGLKRYRLKSSYRLYRDYVKSNVLFYGKAYGRYFLFEIAPVVVAYGLMINFPVSVLLGWALTVETVVSWGLVFYFVSEEVTGIANELKPYIRISAKVDN